MRDTVEEAIAEIIAFTIPMRGNELEALARSDWTEATFTIPMRGNEGV